MTILKKIGKYLLRFFLCVFLLLVLAALLLRIPAAQNYLTESLEDYLQNKLNTEVGIESIRLKLPESITLGGVLIKDLQQDTLVGINQLTVNFQLNKLFQKSIQFDRIDLSGGQANIHIGTDTTNFDFILRAFGLAPDDSTEVAQTTAATSPWVVTFDDAAFSLRQIDFSYIDEPYAVQLHTQIGRLDAAAEKIDYTAHDYQIEYTRLSDATIALHLGEVEKTEPTDTPDTTVIRLHAYTLDIENVDVVFTMPDLELKTHIGKLENPETLLYRDADQLQLSTPQLEISQSHFQYDVPSATRLSEGFDYHHFDLKDIELNIADFSYDNLDIAADLQHLSAQTDNGFNLHELNSNIRFAKSEIELLELNAETNNIQINNSKAAVRYPFFSESKADMQQLNLDVHLDAQANNLADIRYFYPGIDDVPVFKQNGNRPLSITVKTKGTLDQLDISSFDFRGLQSQVKASGKLQHLTQPDKLAFDLSLPRLAAPGSVLSAVLPDSTLPSYIRLPDTIFLSGNATGDIQEFTTNLKAITHRSGAPAPTKIQTRATLKNIRDPKDAAINIQIDTLYTSRPDLLAYLPPATLPEYVNLPEYLILTGEVNGPVADLQSNLQLLTYRAGDPSQIKVLGGVTGLFTDNAPAFDLTVDIADVDRQELSAFLPDSLLPTYFQLPVLNKLKGVIKGTANDFSSQLQLESNTGQWVVEASLQEKKYALDLSVQKLIPESFFEEDYLDSLIGFPIDPLSVNLKLSGEGFDLSESSFGDLLLTVKGNADTTSQGLVVEGKLDRNILKATARISESDIRLRSNLHLNNTGPLPKLLFDLDLEQLDLQGFRLTTQPLELKGRLMAEVRGNGLDTLSGQVLMDDWSIFFDDKSEQIDSLLLAANLDNGKNSIDLTSDFFNAHLDGHFKFPEAVTAFQQMLFSQPTYSDSLIGKTDDHFNFQLEVHRPEILTMGFIPGLENLSPFSLEASYDNRATTFQLQMEIPFFQYQQSDFEHLSLRFNGVRDKLDYEINLQRADIQGAGQAENLSTFGVLENRQLTNTIRMLNEKKEPRYEVQTILRFFDNETFQLQFLPKQLLNYDQWTFTVDNAIRWSKDSLEVQNWRFSKGASAMDIATNRASDEHTLSFENFDLKTVSDFIQRDGGYLGGVLNGNIAVRQLFAERTFAAQLGISDLLVMGARLGDLVVRAEDKPNQIVAAEATLEGEGNDLSLKGKMDLKESVEVFDFLLDIPSVNLAAIEPLAAGYLDQMTGLLAGRLNITGNLKQPSVLGNVQFENAAFDIDLLNTRLNLGNQPIVFDANAIEFKDLEVKDANGSKGIVSSYVLTSDYRDFFLQTELELKDFLVLNTTSKDNDLYYGKLLVDAKAQLDGTLTAPTVDMVVKPKKGSRLTYVYDPYSNDLVTHEGIVEFVVPEDIPGSKPRRKTAIQEASKELNMALTVRASVDENLDFTAITNPIAGDNFRGKAKGDIVLRMFPDGNLELNGQLKAVEGKYLFTYQELVRRPFDVVPGGTLTWTGDPFDPRLDLDVTYQVRTSAYPLLARQNDSESAAGAVPKQIFLVKLNLGGSLGKTDISTSIEYPNHKEGNTADADTKAAINNINRDPSQQNTQAFALILFNGFLAPNVGDSEFRVVDASGSINNVITQQLNGLANRYIKFVEVDFGLDSYESNDDNVHTDFRVSVRKRLLNDRLVISLDGKTTTDSGAEESSSQTYLDNVTIAYSLTPNGRFKIKLYNQRDYDDFVSGTAVKLGGALVFSKDFNRVRFRNKSKRK